MSRYSDDTISTMEVTVYQPGTLEYRQAVDLQGRLAAQVAEGSHPPALLLLEHPHVYTLGRQSDPDELLWDGKILSQRGIQVQESDRGGRITYHGPGQLIGYPILPLGKTGTLAYLRKLEETLIQSLAGFGIPGIRVPGQTGVWVQDRNSAAPPAKIASIGVRVDANRITRHGFALNVAPQMDFWEGIIACGLENQRQTSMADLLSEPSEISVVSQHVLKAFSSVFEARLRIGEKPSFENPPMV
ncbi:MAG: lipoyl(octanoyl) transferase LipB [Anaerolineales bacterium]|nr:lipoyl(octanoyl) transferase LipB [Anaerolineales bacterium]